MTGHSLTVHATCVDISGKGVLIVGPSGSGKSSLALQLMSLGAQLVADDRTILSSHDGTVRATPPRTIAGRIEARGVGIICVEHRVKTSLSLVIDLAQVERVRLPQRHSMTLLDIPLPCLHKVDASYFPAAIHAYVTQKT